MPSHSPRHTIQANNMKSKHAATHSYADLYRKAYITNLDFPGCVRFFASIIRHIEETTVLYVYIGLLLLAFVVLGSIQGLGFAPGILCSSALQL